MDLSSSKRSENILDYRELPFMFMQPDPAAEYTIDPVTGKRYLKVPPITDGQRHFDGRPLGTLFLVLGLAVLYASWRPRRRRRRRR